MLAFDPAVDCFDDGQNNQGPRATKSFRPNRLDVFLLQKLRSSGPTSNGPTFTGASSSFGSSSNTVAQPSSPTTESGTSNTRPSSPISQPSSPNMQPINPISQSNNDSRGSVNRPTHQVSVVRRGAGRSNNIAHQLRWQKSLSKVQFILRSYEAYVDE